MLSITYFYREPRKTGVSIEGIFHLVSQCLGEVMEIQEFYCDPGSSRLGNTLAAANFASEINHITGDVNFLALGLKTGKNILTVHDLGHYDTLKKRSRLQFLVYKWFWFTLPLRRVDMVTVVSGFTKDRLIEYFNFPADKIRVIGNPVKPLFRFSVKEKKGDPFRILMMGTGKHKNLDGLVQAVKGGAYHLDIIGWPAPDELGALKANGVSHTIYSGLTDEEVYERYKACDILFNASFYEGFGMPIIEAQSVGRPVITSDIGAMKEVAGDTAVLVDPYEPKRIRTAIDKLATDREYYDHLVAAGRENVVKYRHDMIAARYMEVYNEVSGQNA